MNSPTQRIDAARKVEADLLGCLMRQPGEIPDVRDRVRIEDFHHDANQRVYRAVLRLHDGGSPVDLVGVCENLRQHGDAAEADSVFVADLWGRGGTGFLAGHHADRVLGLSLERGLAGALSESLGEVESPAAPPDELLGRAQDRLERLAQRVTGTAAVPISEAVNDFLDDLDARARGERRGGLPTGFRMLDDVLCGGLMVGGLTVLAARPSVGKTSLALHVARNACRDGRAALVVSLEQPRRELTERLMAAVADVDGRRLRSGQVAGDDANRLCRAADRLRSWHLRINDHPTQTAGQIAAGARRARRAMKALDLVVVDYLDLVQPDNPKANRNEQVGASCRRLREMARELGVPVLCCCQLNREAAGESEIPKLHHLRNSGEIEQHADAVLFLHRKVAWEPGRPDRVELHVAKQRNGPKASIDFEHRSEVYTFAEATLGL